MVRIDFATLNAYLGNRQCPVFMYSDGKVSLELDLKKRLIGCWDNLNDVSADLKQSVDICVRVGNQLLERCFPFYIDTDWRVVTKMPAGMRLWAGSFHRIQIPTRTVRVWSAGLIWTRAHRKDSGD